MIVKNYIMHSEKWDVCVFFYLEPNTTSCYRKDVIWKKISPLSTLAADGHWDTKTFLKH